MFTQKEIRQLKQDWEKMAYENRGLDNITHCNECHKWHEFCAITRLCDTVLELYAQLEQVQKIKKLPLLVASPLTPFERVQKIIKNI